ncbi:transcriptional regulator, LysR family [Pseudomonas synxantha]|uniref:LysR family transcriptional regulator n=1 Tax=Pseudomonas synxantha TaxID=47883 RepID=A0AAX3IAH2_9PSED|nr:LysR family transcriptional regulator [Pseudomonas synxantha]AZE66458.1 Transcriptional regulator [Pseudomonas synxantha]KRP51823.1 LysR family transcriptional regulator [Pseudomonas synxantha]MDQ0980447.1 DNA-binding transcriptional LysR family regulator [Pseudomonas synxantha]SDU39825.1 transcriptional regulator, LysR family [Pseudomonas synxantha]VTR01148.1 LysR family transcriptional regulator [Pseudomonas synxantha]
MITLKQLEAIYWIVELGSFEAASIKLSMSQSAISKRVQELEDAFDVPIFDRSKRNARLTPKGEELFECAVEMLRQRDYLLDRISSKEALVRRYRLGVTELTALTWLPSLVEKIRAAYPKVALEPSIELSSELFKKLENDQLDLIIVPEIFSDARFASTQLDAVENVWMSAPDLYQENEPMQLQSLASYTVLTQGGSSGTGLIYERWLAEHDVRLNRTLTSNYLVAQVGLTISGVGISYLPKNCLASIIKQGRLKIIHTQPPLPHIRYAAVHRADRLQGLSLEIAHLARQCCDFSHLILDSSLGDNE